MAMAKTKLHSGHRPYQWKIAIPLLSKQSRHLYPQLCEIARPGKAPDDHIPSTRPVAKTCPQFIDVHGAPTSPNSQPVTAGGYLAEVIIPRMVWSPTKTTKQIIN